MSEEESSICVMGIPISLGELVVNSVISTPNVERILSGDALTYHQEDPERKSCLVSLMRPESMCPSRDADSSEDTSQIT